jgi:phage terminase small subunit
MADPLAGAPEKPDWLDPVASELWDRLISILADRRVLSRTDGPAMELL